MYFDTEDTLIKISKRTKLIKIKLNIINNSDSLITLENFRRIVDFNYFPLVKFDSGNLKNSMSGRMCYFALDSFGNYSNQIGSNIVEDIFPYCYISSSHPSEFYKIIDKGQKLKMKNVRIQKFNKSFKYKIEIDTKSHKEVFLYIPLNTSEAKYKSYFIRLYYICYEQPNRYYLLKLNKKIKLILNPP